MTALTQVLAQALIRWNSAIQGREVVIPDIYTSISESAFANENIASVTIPDSIISIGANAFRSNQLQTVSLSSNLKTIGDEAFAFNNLTTIDIPDSVTSIGYGAFWLNNLISVKVGNGVTTIGEGAFEDNAIASVEIGSSVTSIGHRAFATNQLTNVQIPDSVISIGDSAFYWNYLTNVEIGDNVISIGDEAFIKNEITSIIIPSNVALIGREAFQGNKLTSVVIPDSVSIIERAAFRDNQLTRVDIPNGVREIKSYAFANNQLASIDIPSTVQVIKYSAFEGNQLESIGIPDGVTHIEHSAFRNNQLSTVNIPGSIDAIGYYAFANNQLSSITIPDSTTSIGGGAFWGNQLTSLYIPDSVILIEDHAFLNNPSLSSVSVPRNPPFQLSTSIFPQEVNFIRRNSSPTLINASAMLFDENIDAGSLVATLSTEDPDATDTHSYFLVSGEGDKDNKVFSIENNRLKINKTPDFEAQNSYSIRIQTIDSGGLAFESSLNLAVNDLNDEPTDLIVFGSTFNENIKGGAVVAKFSSSDPDQNETFSYSLVTGPGDTNNGTFATDGNQLVILYSPDFESKSSYSVRLQTQDSGGLTLEKSFEFTVNNLNEERSQEPTPTPSPTPTEEVSDNQVQSIDDITTPEEVSTFKLKEPIAVGEKEVKILIIGTDKKDKITGSSDGEVLSGGNNKDILQGGDGADGFLFQEPEGFGNKEVDKVKDFDREEGDSVLVDKNVFSLGKKVKLKLVTGKKASKNASNSKKDFIYDDKRGFLYFNESGKEDGWGDGGMFVKLKGAPELGASDFTIV